MSIIKTILSLVNSKYKSDLTDSVASTKRAAEGIKTAWSAAGSIFGFGIGLGTLLGIAKTTASKLDDLGDSAENLNMPTDEMQRWNFAADKASLGSEALAMSIAKVSGIINDALNGDKMAITKLGMIGLKPEQLSGRGVSEQFGMILDGINRVKDGTEKLALSSDLLGRSGKKIGELAANWREYKQAIGGNIIPEDQIKDAERFEHTLQNLEAIATRLASRTWLISGLTWLGQKAASVYDETPDKQEMGESANKKSYMDVAEAALAKTGKYTTRENTGSFWMPNYQNVTRIPQADKEAWLDKNSPGWRQKEQAAKDEEARNAAEKKRQADALKKQQEDQAEATRLSAKLSPDVEAESKKIQESIDKDRQAQLGLQKALDEQLATMQDQLTIQQLKLKGKDREAAITAEIQKAEKATAAAGRSLEPATALMIAESAGQLYDLENANKPRTFAPPQPEVPVITDAALRVGAFVGPQAQQADSIQSVWRATKDLVQETRNDVRTIKERMPRERNDGNDYGPRFQEA